MCLVISLFISIRDVKSQVHNAILQCIEKIKKDGRIVVVGGGFGVQIMFDAMQLEMEHRNHNIDSAQDRNPTVPMEEYMNYKRTGDNLTKPNQMSRFTSKINTTLRRYFSLETNYRSRVFLLFKRTIICGGKSSIGTCLIVLKDLLI